MIHKFKLGGFNALLDVNSGGVHIIDDLTYDLLDNVEPPFEEKCPEDVVRKLSKMYDSKDIEDCYEEIVSLYNDKILFARTITRSTLCLLWLRLSRQCVCISLTTVT